jgi:hypothetical protein
MITRAKRLIKNLYSNNDHTKNISDISTISTLANLCMDSGSYGRDILMVVEIIPPPSLGTSAIFVLI